MIKRVEAFIVRVTKVTYFPLALILRYIFEDKNTQDERRKNIL
jgi:hypothetical protein